MALASTMRRRFFFLSRELQIHQHSKMYSLTVLVWSMSRMDLLCWAFLYIISTDLHTPNVVVVVLVGGDCIVRKKWCIDIQVTSRESNVRVCPLKHWILLVYFPIICIDFNVNCKAQVPSITSTLIFPVEYGWMTIDNLVSNPNPKGIWDF